MTGREFEYHTGPEERDWTDCECIEVEEAETEARVLNGEKFVTVFNLSTQQELVFSLDPSEAVKVAHLQEQGIWNIWEYENSNVLIEQTDRVVACGNWAAIK